MQMHKTAVAFALSHGLTLGRHENGHYFLRNPLTLEETHLSMAPAAKSALAMMRRALRLSKPGDRVVLTLGKVTMITFKYDGPSSYRILSDGGDVGAVWRRRGGYWTATIGDKMSSTFCRSRKEAVDEALDRAGLKAAAPSCARR